MLGLGLAVGCAPHALVPRAIRARGGALPTLVREVEVRVHQEFPDTWRWQTAFLVPDHYAWTIFTTGAPDRYLFDGSVVRAFVDDREVSTDSSRGAPLRSHARFTAVTNLDALLLPAVRVTSLVARELPSGVTAGVAVTFVDDGSRYLLGVDDRDLVVWATGPVSFEPFDGGEVTARFGDFRRAGRWTLPYRTDYALAGRPLADERVLAACPGDPPLTAEMFQRPGLIPACAAVGGDG
jgi:hypothetical protein